MPKTHETLTSLFSDIADAIRAKTGGTEEIVADSFPTAIGTIPTETPLPTLTNPAAAGDIILHKEAIDGQGAKLTGTLDPLEDAELDPDSPPEIVSGELVIELVHGQDFVKELTYSVPDALPGNIISGKSILGVSGTAKKCTKKTGTVTLAASTAVLSIPELTSLPKVLVLTADSFDAIKAFATADEKPVYLVSVAHVPDTKVSFTAAALHCVYTPSSTVADVRAAGVAIYGLDAVRVLASGTSAKFEPGTYHWTAYEWED